MTDEELIKRVDAWIESRELAGELASLADLWTDVSGRYGPSSAPARGCLLALVREAWGDSGMFALRCEDGLWTVYRSMSESDYSVVGSFGSEGEALVAALEAAP